MTFHIITIFPNVFEPYISESILGRARGQKLAYFNLIDLREFATNKHRSVDDAPFGGGAGMILKVEPIYRAVKAICSGAALRPPSLEQETRDKKQETKEIKNQKSKIKKTRIILLSAKGQKFTQEKARELAKLENIVLICGRYEGVDERVAEHIADEEISIGDYVLTGGELPAMVVSDAVTRLVPGVISEESLTEESFSVGVENFQPLQSRSFQAEYPQYTRPAIFKTNESEEWTVPDVLLSGNHKEIRRWREGKSKIK